MTINMGYEEPADPERPTRKINAYITMSDLIKKKADIRNRLLQYLPDKDRYITPEHRAMLDTLGVSEFAAGGQKQFSQISEPQPEQPDWYPTDKASLAERAAKAPFKFVDKLFKDLTGFGEATLSPTTLKQQQIYQAQSLMKAHINETDPEISNDILNQMKTMSPYLHSEYLGTISNVFQVATGALAMVPKFLVGLKGIQMGGKVAAAAKGAEMAETFAKQVGKAKFKDMIKDPNTFTKIADVMFDPFVKASVINLAAQNVKALEDNPPLVTGPDGRQIQLSKDPGRALGIMIDNITDNPLSTIFTAGMIKGAFKSYSNNAGGFKKKVDVNSVSDSAESAAADFVSDIKRETQTEYKPETANEMNLIREDTMNKYTDLRSRMGRGVVKPDAGIDGRMNDMISGTKSPETMSDLNRIFNAHQDELMRAWFGDRDAIRSLQKKFPNPEIKHIFDPSKKYFSEVLDAIGTEVEQRGKQNIYVAKYLDEQGKDRATEFESEVYATIDKWNKGEIKMGADELVNTMYNIKDKAADFLTGNNLSIRDVFDPFYNDIARDVHEIKTGIENGLELKEPPVKTRVDEGDKQILREIGFDEAKIGEIEKNPLQAHEILSKHKANEIPKGMTPDEILKEATQRAKENEISTTFRMGLSVRDIMPDIISNIENIFLRDADTKLKTFDRPMRNLIKKQIIKTVQEMAEGATDPVKFANDLHNIVEGVYEGKAEIMGMSPDAWKALADGVKESTISEADVELAIRMSEYYKLNPNTAIRINPGEYIKGKAAKELPGVFDFLNVVEEEITNRGPNASKYQKLISIARVKTWVESTTNIAGEALEKARGWLDSADKKEKAIMEMDAMQMEKQELEARRKKVFEAEWDGKTVDSSNEADFMSVMRDIQTLPKFAQKGEVLPRTLIDIMKPVLEKMVNMNAAEMIIKGVTKFEKEALRDMGLGIIPWYKDAAENIVLPKIGKAISDLDAEVKRIDKIEKHRKIKLVDDIKVTDYREGYIPKESLNKHELKRARVYDKFYKTMEEIKGPFFPEMNIVENYQHRQAIEAYHKTNIALSNEMIPNWWRGYKETEAAERAKNPITDTERDTIRRSRSLGPNEKAAKIAELDEKYKEAEARFDTYNKTKNDFIDSIQQSLEGGLEAKEISKEMYDAAVVELKENGMVEGENITKAMEQIKYAPPFVRNRIAAGLPALNDVVNHSAYYTLIDGGFPMDKIKNMPPVIVLTMALREMKKTKQAKAIPAYYDVATMKDWIRNLTYGYWEGKSPEHKMNSIKAIIEADKNVTSMRSLLPYMAEGGKLDPTLIDRAYGDVMYKRGNPLDEAKRYAEVTFRGIQYSPIAKVLNTIKDYVQGDEYKKIASMPKEVVDYISGVENDFVGGDWTTDRLMKAAVLNNSGNAKGGNLIGEAIIKHYANKAGYRNVTVYQKGSKAFIRGDYFDPRTNTVLDGVEGISAESVLPKRMAMRIVSKVKMLSYMALLGLSPRSTVVNLTQPMGPLAYWQKSIAAGLLPSPETINAGMTAYGKMMKELLNPEEFKKLKRSGMASQALMMATEGYSSSGGGWFDKIGKITLSNMTATEYMNRVGMMNYFLELHKGALKDMNLNARQIELMAWDFSNKANFKFDALSQPLFLRTTAGKVFGHLGTFSYNQIKLFAEETDKMMKSIPDVWHQVKKAHVALWRGDWQGFKKEFNTLNNVQRLGVVRYALSTAATVQLMNSVFGFSLGPIMWNRTLQFPGTENPLIAGGGLLYGVLTGDKHPRELGNVAYNFLPMGMAIKKLGIAYTKGDTKWLITNTREIVPGFEKNLGGE